MKADLRLELTCMSTCSEDVGRGPGASLGGVADRGRAGRRAGAGLCGVALALLCLGAACRPGRALAPPRPVAGDRKLAAVAAPGLHNAPGVPLVQSLELQHYLGELLDNHAVKRADRWGLALEPGELAEELMPRYRSTRQERDVDPIEAHFNAGEELFEAELTELRGFGDALGGRKPNFHRVHRGAHGGPDSTSCRSCHHRGGDDGAGEFNEAALLGGDGESERNANERNPPALGGGGAIQILAREISTALLAQLHSIPSGHDYELKLVYQDVDFGTLRTRADGGLDLSGLHAIDPDLIVRPFGWKGTHSTLRRFAEEAFQVHHGLQSAALIERRQRSGTDPRDASPTTRELLSTLGDGPPDDPDRDDAGRELQGANLTAISVYLALLPMPVIMPPRAPDLLAAWRDGGAAFTRIGCAGCHKPSWFIKDPVWIERGEDESSRVRLELDLRKQIRNGPQLANVDTTLGGYPLFIFSDLRRHDMGPGLADRYAGSAGIGLTAGAHGGTVKESARKPSIPPSYFMTRPLWGLAESGPYLHDGRALTVHDAIVAHGGEAEKVRAAYQALPPAQQRAVQVFLLSLTRLPLPEVSP